MEKVLLVLLIAVLGYVLWAQQKQKKRPRRGKKEKEYIPYPVAVRDYGPNVPAPPYRPYNNSTVFSQIGILTDPTGGVADILPLYGRLAPGCSTRYQYYTRTSGTKLFKSKFITEDAIVWKDIVRRVRKFTMVSLELPSMDIQV